MERGKTKKNMWSIKSENIKTYEMKLTSIASFHVSVEGRHQDLVAA